MVLTFALTVPILIAIFSSFRVMSQEKATGVAAITGGFLEGYATFGFLLAFVLPVLAIVLLARSFSNGHRIRTLFSVLCISWSALMFALASGSAWMSFVYMPHIAGGPR
jgi:hypothetical protein